MRLWLNHMTGWCAHRLSMCELMQCKKREVEIGDGTRAKVGVASQRLELRRSRCMSLEARLLTAKAAAATRLVASSTGQRHVVLNLQVGCLLEELLCEGGATTIGGK
eukprot:818705-Amphidinium_carterae.1